MAFKLKKNRKMEQKLTEIAAEILGLVTLETRHRDSLDFHDLAVWQIKAALARAYFAGRTAHADELAKEAR